MFAEDLTPFFAEFAEAVAIERPDGTAVRTASLILDRGATDEQFFGNSRVTTGTPKATGPTADLADVEREWRLTAGAETFVVVAAPVAEDDGALSTVRLRKA